MRNQEALAETPAPGPPCSFVTASCAEGTGSAPVCPLEGGAPEEQEPRAGTGRRRRPLPTRGSSSRYGFCSGSCVGSAPSSFSRWAQSS